ncbi:MAG: hypothetical protein WCD89_24165 [Anaerocolumna sp.]
MSTEGTHSKLLHLLFEMPPERHHVWKVERKNKYRKDATGVSFNQFYLWQYRRQVCGRHWV